MASDPIKVRASRPGDIIRRRLHLEGVVQGVGLRPFAWRLATRLGLAGSVENHSGGVTIEIEGSPECVTAFIDSLGSPPPLAIIERLGVESLPVATGSQKGFAIIGSHRQAGAVTSLPADIATCDSCLAEVGDRENRRHLHPFANCTDCGPRFTIIRGLPYDRATTTLDAFPLCPLCAAEYVDPADRRFHAEPIACPQCGPQVWFSSPARPAAVRPEAVPAAAAAIAAARIRLRAGDILAVKGIGGFHLCCDATNQAAVARLRQRKDRPQKPLAVMVNSVASCREFAEPSAAECRLLASRERPIVLLRKRGDGGPLAAGIAPGIGVVGVMLPAFALHWLLVAGDVGGADEVAAMLTLVMTSGNRACAPIEFENHAAVHRLAPLVDGFLIHDRGIHVPCDDSVVRVAAGHVIPIRRSRGHAPLSIRLAVDGPDILAVGGELKSTICVARGKRAWMSQHIGDITTPESLDSLDRTVRHFVALVSAHPAAVVADLHPGYLSTAYAGKLASALGVPLIRVQHHHAHAASLRADRFATTGQLPNCQTLIASFDGTGFHPDHSIAGCEFFTSASGATLLEPEPVLNPCARLEPFLLPGGDAAIRHPFRTALSLLHGAGIPWDESLAPVQSAGRTAPILRRQLQRQLACTPTTSMGRLFDGVAALLGLRMSVDYEGQAAMAVETAAGERGACPRAYAFTLSVTEDRCLRIGWQSVVERLVADVLAGVAVCDIAAGFQAAVARMIVEVANKVAAGFPGQPAAFHVGLTGGVFQNALLVEETCARLSAAGHESFCHRLVPPNDGGLALGQIVLGREQLARQAGGKCGGEWLPASPNGPKTPLEWKTLSAWAEPMKEE
ncbi:MAG: carbamoyltransferase HypF [Planctomycetota bacterium]|nr:MAG: carbamoyltransferase HypF [Planctomycetota bacterium]